jgi:MFS family permease
MAVSFLTFFLAMGIRYSFGLFFIAILGEYGWGRGETAGAFSLAMVVHALFALVTGTLIDRVGPRKLFPLGAALLALGLVAASRISTIGHFYLFYGVVIAISINTMSYTPHMALISRWFIRKRGLASGLVLSGMGVGVMVLAPVTQFLIDNLGWRSALLVLAGLVLVVLVPMTALFQRSSPDEVGQHPDGVVPEPGARNPSRASETPEVKTENWILKEALCTRPFWALFLVTFCNGLLINTMLVHQTIYLVDVGHSQILAASILGLVGLLGSVGGILFGLFSDRFGREIAYTLGSTLALAGALFLPFVGDTTHLWMLYGFAVLYGLGYGSTPSLTASKTGDLFPGSSLGRIMSTQAISFGSGGAIGPYVGGYFYDKMGNYFYPFLLVLLSIVVGIIGIWMAVPTRGHSGAPNVARATTKEE